MAFWSYIAADTRDVRMSTVAIRVVGLLEAFDVNERKQGCAPLTRGDRLRLKSMFAPSVAKPMPKLLMLLCLLCIAPAHAERDIVIEGGTGDTQPLNTEPDIVIEGGASEPQPAPQLPAPRPPAPAQVKLLDCALEASLRSSKFDRATRVQFVNETAHERRTYWINYEGRRVPYSTLAPGESYTQETYVTHPWVMTDGAERCVAIYLPDETPSRVVMP